MTNFPRMVNNNLFSFFKKMLKKWDGKDFMGQLTVDLQKFMNIAEGEKKKEWVKLEEKPKESTGVTGDILLLFQIEKQISKKFELPTLSPKKWLKFGGDISDKEAPSSSSSSSAIYGFSSSSSFSFSFSLFLFPSPFLPPPFPFLPPPVLSMVYLPSLWNSFHFSLLSLTSLHQRFIDASSLSLFHLSFAISSPFPPFFPP